MIEQLQHHTEEQSRSTHSSDTPTAGGSGVVNQPRAAGPQVKRSLGLRPRGFVIPRVLIVTDEDGLAATLGLSLHQAGVLTERVATLTEAIDAASSGRFSVVVTTPQLRDGSWRRLTATARRCRPQFAIIVVARTFDLADWAEALKDGAFDVLDTVHELPRAAEFVRRALWTEYLTGAWPDLRIPHSRAS